MKQVFISYRHESEDHARAVRNLGELLREDGFPVQLDQFYLEENPGGPDKGWPDWCEQNADQSECVLIIPSRGWIDAYSGDAPPSEGFGVARETHLFKQYIYDQKNHNKRIRLAFVDDLPLDCSIPAGLKGWHQFQPIDSPKSLDELRKWIAARLELDATKLSKVRWPAGDAEFIPEMADRTQDEWPALVNLFKGEAEERILFFEAPSGHGKSKLVEECKYYIDGLKIPNVVLDFKTSFDDLQDLLGHIDLELGQHLPEFSGSLKAHKLKKDLRRRREPIAFLLDTFDRAPKQYQDWVTQHLLTEVKKCQALAVLVAGKVGECPDSNDTRWMSRARKFDLGPIKDPKLWQDWIDRQFPHFPKDQINIEIMVNSYEGFPKMLSDVFRTIGKKHQEENGE